MRTTRTYNGFRLIDGTVDNTKCPHLHMIEDGRRIACQTCGKDFGCPHANIDEYFGKCDDCGVEVHTCDWKTGPNGIPVLVHCVDCCRCEATA